MFNEFARDETRFDDRRRDGYAGVKPEPHKYVARLLLIFFRPPVSYGACRMELAS
jgi:hypothetical protein